jgi:hypothetical protein
MENAWFDLLFEAAPLERHPAAAASSSAPSFPTAVGGAEPLEKLREELQALMAEVAHQQELHSLSNSSAVSQPPPMQPIPSPSVDGGSPGSGPHGHAAALLAADEQKVDARPGPLTAVADHLKADAALAPGQPSSSQPTSYLWHSVPSEAGSASTLNVPTALQRLQAQARARGELSGVYPGHDLARRPFPLAARS